jgi:long-chain acyl-CoA synthetase
MNHNETTFITANLAGTLDGLMRERIRISSDKAAYQYFDKISKEWVELNWATMGERISRYQQALEKEDLHEGDRVAILLKNCPEWVTFEQAALGLGLVVVPLYMDDRPDNVAYILNDSGCKAMLVQDEKMWNALVEQKEELPDLKRVILLQSKSEDVIKSDERLVLAEDWQAKNARPLPERGGDPHKLASIVYTSGTTGKPKGVMLSHSNILSITQFCVEALEMNERHQVLSFLPLSHTFERTCGYYVPLMCGAPIAYSRSVQQIADDIQIIKPTAMIAVPRIFERIYEKLHASLRKQSIIHRLLFRLAVNVGWKNFEYEQKRRYWSPSLLLWPILRKLVASKLQQRLGGHLIFAVSGGAALPPIVAKTFIGLGINIIQGYGMTETSPVLTANIIAENDPFSVGKALPGVALKIDSNDELLARSPGVMMGYWNNHKATSDIITADGWLHTGDKAAIRNGYVYITGRIKDILVMSNGEKIPPGNMESAIALHPLFEQALIVGEGRAYLAALIVINSDEWFSLAKEHGLDPFQEDSLLDKKLHSYVVRQISDALHDFPGFAKVRRVHLVLEPWTVENAMLTPTLKVKRAKVIEHYAIQIKQMYDE